VEDDVDSGLWHRSARHVALSREDGFSENGAGGQEPNWNVFTYQPLTTSVSSVLPPCPPCEVPLRLNFQSLFPWKDGVAINAHLLGHWRLNDPLVFVR
jgi:hypothetical protein